MLDLSVKVWIGSISTSLSNQMNMCQNQNWSVYQKNNEKNYPILFICRMVTWGIGFRHVLRYVRMAAATIPCTGTDFKARQKQSSLRVAVFSSQYIPMPFKKTTGCMFLSSRYLSIEEIWSVFDLSVNEWIRSFSACNNEQIKY